MRMTAWALACVAAAWIALAWAAPDADIARELLALERKAMDGWQKGDPDPQLAISDPEITYIHDVVGKRLEGIAALKELYAGYRGAPVFDRYEILSPKVHAVGDVAVLTYQLTQYAGATTRYWNATQVYRKKPEGWRIIHTHWSAVNERRP